jgi:hypothetical protein
MKACFSPSWVSCLDKSMTVWMNMWTCPGWMFVPQKPHPMGNEYHSICCGLSGIMFAIKLVQGKDRPSQIPNEKYSEHGKTIGLLVRLTESIHHFGRVVIMDSGFGWRLRICSDKKASLLAEVHLRRVNFKIFCMKEEVFVMKLMATYGALRSIDGGLTQRSVTRRSGTRKNVSFVYTEPFSNHFQFRHQDEDHNNAQYSPISLEESVNTKDWKIRVFSSILAVAEVNVQLAHSIFSQSDALSQLDFS